MSDGPSVRPFEPRDTERVVEVAESSMTASYALSPNDIEIIHDEEFAGDTLRARSEDPDADIAVGEVDGVVAGFVETSVENEYGVVRWLHVDPERRGRGVGTTLFEHAVEELEDRCDEVRAIVLSSNTSPGRSSSGSISGRSTSGRSTSAAERPSSTSTPSAPRPSRSRRRERRGPQRRTTRPRRTTRRRSRARTSPTR
ncbi:hypothetical protein C2R22_05605 [Salinigranum rubrum]|uniref:N-acetyltransferase domain-containing protein n=1 Tax=Salinigranum rubrum TaxID=755307 RepID=A0A2I8VGZ6_9EURY|nr:hypothetical protein C2R22_05605 [Salinigranum rubrum]